MQAHAHLPALLVGIDLDVVVIEQAELDAVGDAGEEREVRAAAVILGLASGAMVWLWDRRGLAELLLVVCLLFTAVVAFVTLVNPSPLLDPDHASVPAAVLEAKAAEFRAGVAEARNEWSGASAGYTSAAAVFTNARRLSFRCELCMVIILLRTKPSVGC